MARTMSASEHEDRGLVESVDTWNELTHESQFAIARAFRRRLDAERAAHEETKAALYAEQSANAHMRSVVDNDATELTALKAKLALAEAVCDRLASGRVEPLKIAAELSAWRAAK